MRYWGVILVLAAIELVAGYHAAQPCGMDLYRRCDLEPPNPMPTDCGLRHAHMC